jgi:hypothetical protein
MNDAERLESIRKMLTPAPGLSPSAAGITRDDIDFLLSRVTELEKKNNVLSRHVLELTEEMENVRMDFGGNR